MTAQELIEELQWAIENNGNQDIEVRMAQQPKWPFEYSINAAVTVNLNQKSDEPDEWVVYLEEGSELGYLPEEASEEVFV